MSVQRILRVVSLLLSAFWAVPIVNRLVALSFVFCVRHLAPSTFVKDVPFVFDGPFYLFPSAMAIAVGGFWASRWKSTREVLIAWAVTFAHLVVWLIAWKPVSVLMVSESDRFSIFFLHKSTPNVNAVMPFYIATAAAVGALVFTYSERCYRSRAMEMEPTSEEKKIED